MSKVQVVPLRSRSAEVIGFVIAVGELSTVCAHITESLRALPDACTSDDIAAALRDAGLTTVPRIGHYTVDTYDSRSITR